MTATDARAQHTIYGGDSAPFAADGGYVSDYSTAGTMVAADGSVTLSNHATYEHGNSLLDNNGSWTATTGSLDLFLSVGNNTISGSTAPSFFNVHFNIGAGSTMAVTNAQGIRVAGQAQFSNGITTTVRSNHFNGSILFADGAAYMGANTDTRHVNGYVSKAGDEAFTFPVGSGTDLRTLSITAPTGNVEISTAWFAGNPTTVADPSDGSTHDITSVAAPLVSVSTAGFWDWIPVSGSDDGITVTVSIPDMQGFALTTDLRLAGWDGTQWIDLSGSATASGNTENSKLSGTIPAGITITAIGIGGLNTPLPIMFRSFEVAQDGCKAVLNWSTAMEQHNDHFELERSADGRSFSVIGTVRGAGNSNEIQQYSFVDAHPVSGMNHYRITQVDIDGMRSSTTVKTLRFDCSKGTIKVYPTMTKGTLYVDMPAGYEQAKVIMIDISGREVVADIPETGLFRTVRLNSMSAGTFLLRIESSNTVETFKVMYQP